MTVLRVPATISVCLAVLPACWAADLVIEVVDVHQRPLPGVRLTLEPEVIPRVFTDETGKAAVRVEAKTRYRVTADLAGFRPANAAVTCEMEACEVRIALAAVPVVSLVRLIAIPDMSEHIYLRTCGYFTYEGYPSLSLSKTDYEAGFTQNAVRLRIVDQLQPRAKAARNKYLCVEGEFSTDIPNGEFAGLLNVTHRW